MRTSHLAAGIVVLVSGAGTFAAAQRQAAPPTFRTETNIVVVDVRVVDADGNFVSDLRREEFRLFEDGVEQTITTSELVDLSQEPPPESQLPVAANQPSDVSSNRDEGRLYVLILDDTTFVAPTGRLNHTREVGRDFVLHMAPGDRAAIVTTGGRRDMAQEFTDDRERLLAKIDPFGESRGQQNDPPTSMLGPAPPNPFDSIQDVMYSLKDTARWLAGIPARRKAIVVISPRMGAVSASLSLTNWSKAPGLQDVGTAQVLRDVVAMTSQANTSIYIINPSSGPGRLPAEYGLADPDADPDRRVSISQATGGFSSSGETPGVFERIADEVGSYYLLGYTSPTPNTDTKFRRIGVRTTRENLRVRTRGGFHGKDVNPLKSNMIPKNMPMPLTEAMQSPAPVGGIPMSMSVIPYRGKGSKALVSIAIDIHDERLADRPPRPAGKLIDFAIAAAKVNAKVVDLRNVSVSSGTIVARMELKPGAYHMRIGALDTADSRRGSLLYDVDVPDFSKRGLVMSGIALTLPRARPRTISGSDERWKTTLGTPPTTQRMFEKSDELVQYVEVYDNRRSVGEIAVTTSVRNAAGDVVFNEPKTSSVKPAKGTLPVHGIKTSVPLSRLPPGTYVLEVEARAIGAAADPVSRSIPFGVR